MACTPLFSQKLEGKIHTIAQVIIPNNSSHHNFTLIYLQFTHTLKVCPHMPSMHIQSGSVSHIHTQTGLNPIWVNAHPELVLNHFGPTYELCTKSNENGSWLESQAAVSTERFESPYTMSMRCKVLLFIAFT